jgi:DNA-nicking Smr family endonuclease
LSAEEAALWARVARSVRPLSIARTPPPPHIHHAREAAERRDSWQARSRSAPPPQRSAGAPAERGGERRVRRGKLEIDATLDLHGLTQDRARAALKSFLARAQGEGARAVVVVTGKGGRLQSGEAAPGVLKRRLPDWLAAAELRPLVAGYAAAHARHGGGGAFYVFLRRRD